MIEENLQYEVDGETLFSTLYRLDGDMRKPGVLVFPDIMGLGDHARERARWLAELGYVALAVDLHCEGRVLAIPDAMAELDRFYADVQRPLRRAEASLQALREQPAVDADRIGAIGFCYGGTISLEMARIGSPLAAVVGFHSVLDSTLEQGGERINAKILICVGAEDPQVPNEQRRRFEEEMRRKGADWQIHLYGGVYHTFTDWRADGMGVPDMARYDGTADRRSWKAMANVLADAFGEQ